MKSEYNGGRMEKCCSLGGVPYVNALALTRLSPVFAYESSFANRSPTTHQYKTHHLSIKNPYFSDCSPAWIHPVSKFHHCHYCTFHIILNAKFITPPRAPLPRTALDLRLQPRPPSPGPAIASPQCACPTKPVGINVSQVPLEKLQKQKLGWRDGYVLTLKMSSTAVLFFLSSCPPPKNARSRHVAGPIVPRATASSAVETRRPALARKNTRDVIKNCPRMF